LLITSPRTTVDARFETHHRVKPLNILERARHRLADLGDRHRAPALQFDQQRDLTVNEIKHRLQHGDRPARCQFASGEFLGAASRQRTLLAGQPIKFTIVEDDGHAIAAAVNVALDPQPAVIAAAKADGEFSLARGPCNSWWA
jgi:hypothetical protein